jgi:uncharacterized protein YrzB (UPF0473 family)
MLEDENYEPDLLEMTDEDGNTLLVQVMDYFFYNGVEYAILTDAPAEENTAEVPEEVNCYVVRVNAFTDENGEEMEEFVPIEDADLEARLIEIASTRLNDDEEEEEI